MNVWVTITRCAVTTTVRCDVNACLPPTCADYLPIDRYARLIDVCLQHKHDQSGLVERFHLTVAVFRFNFYAVVRLALHHGVVAHFHRCSTNDAFILNLVQKETKQNDIRRVFKKSVAFGVK